jgi:xanthine dehydrogenase YagR molybdenum-binding subunit
MARVIKTKVEFEGQFYEKSIVVEPAAIAPWEGGRTFSIVGRPQSRVDGIERVTGSATFTHDINLAGMLYGKILRCPHASARIKKLDTKKAESLPGVRLVLTRRNVAEIPWYFSQTSLFDTTLRYAGEEVACVVADDEALCEDALRAITVEYERLSFVLDPQKALEDDAPKIRPSGNRLEGPPAVYARGDLDQGFSEAVVTVEGEFHTQTALHNCLETHGSVASWEGENLTLWDSTQNIFGVRDQVARALGLGQHQVRVIKQYMGGGFGSKNDARKYAVMAAVAARQTGRPVKICLDRHEENLAAGNRPASVQVMRIGAKRDGTLTAIHHKATVVLGAYAAHLASPCGPTRRMYRCPHLKTEDFGVFTHSGPWSAFRAPGYVEGTFVLESMMDEAAKKLGMDPLALRLRNYATVDPLTDRPYTTKGLRQAYARGSELIGWKNREAIKQAQATATTRVGFGMASQVWGGSGGPPAYALLKINPDGTVIVVTGTQDIGTGTKTVLAQIAAEALGFPVAFVKVQLGDTRAGVYSPLSAGSMTLPSMGPAVRAAAEDARQQLLEIAAQILETGAGQVAIASGRIVETKTGRRSKISAVLGKLNNCMIVGRGARAPNPEDKNINTFGAQYAQVAVDLETGRVKVIKIVAVHESGRVINPLTARSQLEGGVIQGLGFALCEQRWMDPCTGVVINADLDQYKLPTSEDIPEIVTELIDLPDPGANSIGAKGLGEPPIIPTAAAVANAVADALGKRIYQLPLTPDRVLSVLEKGKNQ